MAPPNRRHSAFTLRDMPANASSLADRIAALQRANESSQGAFSSRAPSSSAGVGTGRRVVSDRPAGALTGSLKERIARLQAASPPPPPVSAPPRTLGRRSSLDPAHPASRPPSGAPLWSPSVGEHAAGVPGVRPPSGLSSHDGGSESAPSVVVSADDESTSTLATEIALPLTPNLTGTSVASSSSAVSPGARAAQDAILQGRKKGGITPAEGHDMLSELHARGGLRGQPPAKKPPPTGRVLSITQDQVPDHQRALERARRRRQERSARKSPSVSPQPSCSPVLSGQESRPTSSLSRRTSVSHESGGRTLTPSSGREDSGSPNPGSGGANFPASRDVRPSTAPPAPVEDYPFPRTSDQGGPAHTRVPVPRVEVASPPPQNPDAASLNPPAPSEPSIPPTPSASANTPGGHSSPATVSPVPSVPTRFSAGASQEVTSITANAPAVTVTPTQAQAHTQAQDPAPTPAQPAKAPVGRKAASQRLRVPPPGAFFSLADLDASDDEYEPGWVTLVSRH